MAEKIEQKPKDMEEKHVHSVYSEIAKHFSETRYKPWPQIAEFINTLKPGALLADIGKIPYYAPTAPRSVSTFALQTSYLGLILYSVV